MLYRRLWLGLLIVVFAVVAPAVVFYTAGYRWNAKKGVIERNGTLIIDTEPSGARIVLNGQDSGNRTPVTRQDVAPGTYHIRLERDGYWPWEKTLEVRPERVTFITDVWLWRNSAPSFLRDATVMGMAASPDGEFLAFVEQKNAAAELVLQPVPDNGLFGIPAGAGGEQRITLQGESATGTVHLTWNADSSGVLIKDAQGSAWVAGVDATTADRLPSDSVYRWEGNVLVGVRTGERFAYNVLDGTVQQTTLNAGVIDEQGRYRMIVDAAGAQSIVEIGDETRRFSLPAGTWVFAGAEDDWLFLRNQAATPRWLAFRPNADADEIRFVNLPAVEIPEQTVLANRDLFLSYGNGELWAVTLEDSAELLTRTSQSITGAVWHANGPSVFYATQKHVNAIGLDTRDGREQATLASFDAITHITAAGTDLYIAGTKDGQTGIWMIATE